MVCLDAQSCVLMLPCSHLCVCDTCAATACGRTWRQPAYCPATGDEQCPVCRTQLTATLAVTG